MFNKSDDGIFISDNFVYRINPHDYIALTKEILSNRNIFGEIEKIKKEWKPGHSLNEEKRRILNRYGGLLKRHENDKASEDPENYFSEILKDYETYKYFYKEIGASLKFNPLSNSDAGRHVLEKILFFLEENVEKITPKAIYKQVNTVSHPEGLMVAGTDIKFENSRLKIFTSHSSFNDSIEINAKDLLNKNVIVYVVTIGPGIDNEVKIMMEKGEMFEAYLLNGIGAGAAEMIANDLNRYMNDRNKEEEFEYKRMSPGYGDWNVSDQAKIFKLLDPKKHIEVKLTDSYIMLPEKSTSGIMGLTLKEKV